MFPRVVSSYVRLCAEKQKRFDALAAGHRDSVICGDVSRSAIFLPTSVFQHTIPTTQTKGSQQSGALRARRFAECRHEPLSVGMRLSPWLSPTAPAAPQRFACHFVGSIERTTRSMSRSGRFVLPCDSPAGFASQMPSGPPHRLTPRSRLICMELAPTLNAATQ